jgi:hypothetical protein
MRSLGTKEGRKDVEGGQEQWKEGKKMREGRDEGRKEASCYLHLPFLLPSFLPLFLPSFILIPSSSFLCSCPPSSSFFHLSFFLPLFGKVR